MKQLLRLTEETKALGLEITLTKTKTLVERRGDWCVRRNSFVVRETVNQQSNGTSTGEQSDKNKHKY